MTVSLTQLRRIGTGLMLVAMLAFTVGTAWVPAPGSGGRVSGGLSASLANAGPTHSHMHEDGTVHSHRVATAASVDDDGWPPFPQLDDVPDHDHEDPTFFGLAQSLAVLAMMASAPGANARTTTLGWPEPARPFGVDPSGLKRPPRPLPTA